MADTKQLLDSCKEKMAKTAQYLEDTLGRIRAGRANVHILDAVKVESYGTVVPLNQVSNVQIQDARTITITPYDRNTIREIEKAIMAANVGITPENNGEMIRLNIPQPTEERRHELTKQCNGEGEKAKVQVRNIRRDGIDRLKKMIKEGLSEDLEKDAESDLQKQHDQFIKKIEEILAEKNKEIMTV